MEVEVVIWDAGDLSRKLRRRGEASCRSLGNGKTPQDQGGRETRDEENERKWRMMSWRWRRRGLLFELEARGKYAMQFILKSVRLLPC